MGWCTNLGIGALRRKTVLSYSFTSLKPLFRERDDG